MKQRRVRGGGVRRIGRETSETEEGKGRGKEKIETEEGKGWG